MLLLRSNQKIDVRMKNRTVKNDSKRKKEKKRSCKQKPSIFLSRRLVYL